MAAAPPGSFYSQAADESEVERLLSESQWFLALDAAKTALERYPSSLKLQRGLARALLKLGAAQEAKKILEPLCVPKNLDDPIFLSLYQQFRQTAATILAAPVPQNGPVAPAPSRELLMAFADMVGVTSRAAERVATAQASDEETLGLLGSTYKELFKESGKLEDARRSRDMYLRAFHSTRGYWTCINAATMSCFVGRLEKDRPEDALREQATTLDLATNAAEICSRQLPTATGVSRFWLLATLGEALLHLGKEADAIAAYAQACATKGVEDPQRISAFNQLQLLRQWGLRVPQTILDSLKLPQVAVFVGHMIDAPGRYPPRFPAELEGYVRGEIERHISELDIRIVYGSAACGADLLFIEAMQDREAEVNVVLPFDAEDFVNTSVAFAGPDWVRRFRRAIKLAGKHVTFATAERYFGTVGLLAYANQIIQGLAYLRARGMGSEPYLLAVYDNSGNALGGGTADVVSGWGDKDRVRVIELPNRTATSVSVPAMPLESPPPSDSAVHLAAPSAAERVVRAMLFADVVGFSQLREEQVPYFMYEFLNEIAKHLKDLPEQPRIVNTWGDAIFAVMDHALPMVEYARTLQRVVCATDWRKLGMPAEMSVRIGLHIGPVFEGMDAITLRNNCFGSHVNRATRIEQVTVPGYIYASQQFVAILTSEQRSAVEPPGGWPYTCEFLGTLNLAKNFGVLATYYIRGRHGR